MSWETTYRPPGTALSGVINYDRNTHSATNAHGFSSCRKGLEALAVSHQHQIDAHQAQINKIGRILETDGPERIERKAKAEFAAAHPVRHENCYCTSHRFLVREGQPLNKPVAATPDVPALETTETAMEAWPSQRAPVERLWAWLTTPWSGTKKP